MSKLITHIKRLALALCLATPFVSRAVTTTGYEDFGDTAGVVLWRGTQNDFHASTVADVAADGTVGDEYTMNTSGHPWQVFASNMSAYTSPGKVLVYDTPGTDQGYKYNPDCSFGPLSFGGMWVKTLAINGQPFSILGTGNRTTEFGATGKSTLFKFDASYTINRSGTTTFYGNATVDFANGATFTAQARSGYSVAVDSAATLKLKGVGTLAVTTMTVAGTLDLSAETVPTIAGNVTLSTGSTLVVPENTTAIEVCSGTLTVGEIMVKIGDAEPAIAEVTTSEGSITSISVVTETEKTFTSDYPSEVPYGYTYTYEATEAVTIPAVTVNGTLKTSGPITITDLDIANGADFEVVAGNTTVGCSADCKLKGNITVDAGATLTNTRTDSLSYNHSMTVDVYGTLAMGTTRWSIPGGCTFKLQNGAQVTGAGDGWASLDFINGASRGLDVYGSATIEGKMRVRANETRIWVNEGSTLVLSSGIADGGGHHAGFKQVGLGTLEIHANSTGLSGNASIMTQGTLRLVDTTLAFPVALQGNNSYLEVVATEAATVVPVNVTSIANNNVTFSGAGKVNGSITKTSAPSGNLATALQSAAWTGTFVADWAGNKDTRFDINSYGNANSVVEVTQLAGGYVKDTSAYFYVVPTVNVSGTMTLNNGYTGTVTVFPKLTGSGTVTINTYPVTITMLDKFTGTFNSNANDAIEIGTINLAATPEPGDKIVSIGSSGSFYGLASTKVAVEGVVDSSFTGNLEKKSDGIYVKNVVTVTVPAVDNTTVTVVVGEETIGTAAGNYDVAPGSVVTVTYAAADGYQISGTTEYTIDTASATTFDPSETTQVAQIVAQIRTSATTYEYYTTLAGALASPNVAYGITLRANIDEDEVTVSSPVMITGAYTISSDIKIVDGGQLQLMLVTMAGTLTIEEDGIYATGGGTLNELVTKDGAKIQLTTLSATAAPLAVTTLSVEGNLTIISSWGSAVRDTYYKAISYVTENADIAEGATVDSVNEWSAKVEEEGDNTVVYLAITKVAVVDGVYYDDAQDAVYAAVASGEPVSFLVAPGTVKLGAGETLVVSGATLPTVELDDGLTTPPYEIVHTVDGEQLTNTYRVKHYVAQITRKEYSSELGWQNIVYTYETLAEAITDAQANETVVVVADAAGVVGANANDITLDLAGCTITGGDAIKWTGTGKLTIVDSVGGGQAIGTAADGCALWVTGGSVEVQAGYFQNSSAEEATVYVGVAGASVTITGGTFKNTVQDYEWGNSDFDYYSLNVQNKLSATAIQVSGGSFSHDPAKGDDKLGSLLVAGKATVYNELTGLWTVTTAVAQIGAVPYASLTAAITAAQTDDTVKLLTDTEGVVGANANDITLDLAGRTITGGDAIKWTGTGKLTIVDSVGGGQAIGTADDGCALWVTGGSVEVQAGSFQNNSEEEATVYVNGEGATVTITGGTFRNQTQNYKWGGSDFDYYSLNVGNSRPATSIQVSGGSFSHDPAKGDDKLGSLLVAGYESTYDDKTALWSVAEVQEVPVTPGAKTEPVDTEAEAEAEAAKVVPSVPTAVAEVLSDDQETAYKALFEAKVVEVAGETTKYAVEVVLKAEVVADLQEAVEAEAGDIAEAAVAAAADVENGGEAEVTTVPGLYYVVEAGSEVDAITPASCKLATSESTKLTIPNKGTSGFYKISVSVTPVAVPSND